MQQPRFLGSTWQEPPAVLPRLMGAVSYARTSVGLSGRIRQPFWVLDYSCRHCGLTRVGTPKSPWRERLRVGGSVSLAEIAKAVHVSPSTLSHRYAAESGRSPLAAFHAMRLEIARALLMQGGSSLMP
ncbi:MAG: hypothetical protein NTV93_07355 [Verrucomicrobia bacterium]|nr:hypothetical protein [Verrucomicrobiota bacterium]